MSIEYTLLKFTRTNIGMILRRAGTMSSWSTSTDLRGRFDTGATQRPSRAPLQSCQIGYMLGSMDSSDKPLVWLHGEVKTPPFSANARIEAGVLLRRLQRGDKFSLPHSRPMPGIGPACHELRVPDDNLTWRIIYRIDGDAIVIADVFEKKTRATPKRVIDTCKRRLRRYDETTE